MPGARELGLDPFYPIVPDATWLARLLPLGIKTVQLRLKDAPRDEVLRQIETGMKLCARHGCTFIVNDYWWAAVELGADFVHLGQEDLVDADLATMRRAGIRLGVSTHSLEELAIGLKAKPDYVALGPVYETKLKAMKWAPQGLDKVREWKSRLTVPLVAIAGITIERADGVMDAGADSCAVITDFITHADPEARVRQWVAWSRRRLEQAR